MSWARLPDRGRGGDAVRPWLNWRAAALAMLFAVTALPAAAGEFTIAPGQRVVGELGRYVIKKGDVFVDIARRFDVGYTELVAANPGVDPWVPGVGRAITIPTLYVLPDAPQRGIVINLAQWRLFYFPPGGGRVETHPLGLGVIGKKTPIGTTRVVRKVDGPAWYPPASIRAERPDLPAMVPAGPDNPLGAFALYLGWPKYLIHGTNKPDGVGRNVSHGCIRLYPDDIAHLFSEVAVGTPVQVVDQPVAVGRLGDALYVAVYPSKTQVDEIDTERPITADPAQGAEQKVAAVAGQNAAGLDWAAVSQAASERTGMPVAVTAGAGLGPVAVQPDRRQSAPPYDGEAWPAYDSAAAPSYDSAAAPSYDSTAVPSDDSAALPSYDRAPPSEDGTAADFVDREAAQPYGSSAEPPLDREAAQAEDGQAAPFSGGGAPQRLFPPEWQR